MFQAKDIRDYIRSNLSLQCVGHLLNKVSQAGLVPVIVLRKALVEILLYAFYLQRQDDLHAFKILKELFTPTLPLYRANADGHVAFSTTFALDENGCVVEHKSDVGSGTAGGSTKDLPPERVPPSEEPTDQEVAFYSRLIPGDFVDVWNQSAQVWMHSKIRSITPDEKQMTEVVAYDGVSPTPLTLKVPNKPSYFAPLFGKHADPFRKSLEEKGAVLDARDRVNMWYTATVAEFRPESQTVIVQFDGWGSQFNEAHFRFSYTLQPKFSRAKGGKNCGVQDSGAAMRDLDDPENVVAWFHGAAFGSQFMTELLNVYAEQGGLQYVTERLTDLSPTALFPVPILRATVELFASFTKQFARPFAKTFIPQFAKMVTTKVLNLSDADLRTLGKEDLRVIENCLQTLLDRVKPTLEVQCEIDSFRLNTAMQRIRSPIFEQRLYGFAYLNDIMDNVRTIEARTAQARAAAEKVAAEKVAAEKLAAEKIAAEKAAAEKPMESTSTEVASGTNTSGTADAASPTGSTSASDGIPAGTAGSQSPSDAASPVGELAAAAKVEETQWLTTQLMVEFIIKENIDQMLLHPKEHTEILRKGAPAVVFIAAAGSLTDAHLQLMWEALEAAAAVRDDGRLALLSKLLDDLSPYLKRQHIEFLYNKVESLPLEAHQEFTVELVANLAKWACKSANRARTAATAASANLATDPEQFTAASQACTDANEFSEVCLDRTLNLLWRCADAASIPATATNQAQQQLELISASSLELCKSRRVDMLHRCIKNLQELKCVEASVKLFLRILRTYPDVSRINPPQPTKQAILESLGAVCGESGNLLSFAIRVVSNLAESQATSKNRIFNRNAAAALLDLIRAISTYTPFALSENEIISLWTAFVGFIPPSHGVRPGQLSDGTASEAVGFMPDITSQPPVEITSRFFMWLADVIHLNIVAVSHQADYKAQFSSKLKVNTGSIANPSARSGNNSAAEPLLKKSKGFDFDAALDTIATKARLMGMDPDEYIKWCSLKGEDPCAVEVDDKVSDVPPAHLEDGTKSGATTSSNVETSVREVEPALASTTVPSATWLGSASAIADHSQWATTAFTATIPKFSTTTTAIASGTTSATSSATVSSSATLVGPYLMFSAQDVLMLYTRCIVPYVLQYHPALYTPSMFACFQTASLFLNGIARNVHIPLVQKGAASGPALALGAGIGYSFEVESSKPIIEARSFDPDAEKKLMAFVAANRTALTSYAEDYPFEILVPPTEAAHLGGQVSTDVRRSKDVYTAEDLYGLLLECLWHLSFRSVAKEVTKRATAMLNRFYSSFPPSTSIVDIASARARYVDMVMSEYRAAVSGGDEGLCRLQRCLALLNKLFDEVELLPPPAEVAAIGPVARPHSARLRGERLKFVVVDETTKRDPAKNPDGQQPDQATTEIEMFAYDTLQDLKLRLVQFIDWPADMIDLRVDNTLIHAPANAKLSTIAKLKSGAKITVRRAHQSTALPLFNGSVPVPGSKEAYIEMFSRFASHFQIDITQAKPIPKFVREGKGVHKHPDDSAPIVPVQAILQEGVSLRAAAGDGTQLEPVWRDVRLIDTKALRFCFRSCGATDSNLAESRLKSIVAADCCELGSDYMDVDGFVSFYVSAADQRPQNVWADLYAMGYSSDLVHVNDKIALDRERASVLAALADGSTKATTEVDNDAILTNALPGLKTLPQYIVGGTSAYFDLIMQSLDKLDGRRDSVDVKSDAVTPFGFAPFTGRLPRYQGYSDVAIEGAHVNANSSHWFNETISKQALLGQLWNILQRCTTNPNVQRALELKDGCRSLGEIIDASSPFRLLYALQVIEMKVSDPTAGVRSSWSRALLERNGFDYFFGIMSGKTPILHNFISQKPGDTTAMPSGLGVWYRILTKSTTPLLVEMCALLAKTVLFLITAAIVCERMELLSTLKLEEESMKVSSGEAENYDAVGITQILDEEKALVKKPESAQSPSSSPTSMSNRPALTVTIDNDTSATSPENSDESDSESEGERPGEDTGESPLGASDAIPLEAMPSLVPQFSRQVSLGASRGVLELLERGAADINATFMTVLQAACALPGTSFVSPNSFNSLSFPNYRVTEDGQLMVQSPDCLDKADQALIYATVQAWTAVTLFRPSSFLPAIYESLRENPQSYLVLLSSNASPRLRLRLALATARIATLLNEEVIQAGHVQLMAPRKFFLELLLGAMPGVESGGVTSAISPNARTDADYSEEFFWLLSNLLRAALASSVNSDTADSESRLKRQSQFAPLVKQTVALLCHHKSTEDLSSPHRADKLLGGVLRVLSELVAFEPAFSTLADSSVPSSVKGTLPAGASGSLVEFLFYALVPRPQLLDAENLPTVCRTLPWKDLRSKYLSYACVAPSTRAATFKLMLLIAKNNPAAFGELVELVHGYIRFIEAQQRLHAIAQLPDPNDEAKLAEALKAANAIAEIPPRAGPFVGLRNQGATCYMNSLFQQLFNIRELRTGLLLASDELNGAPESLLGHIQLMFGSLLESQHQFYNPVQFVANYKDTNGRPVDPREQQDVQEFYNVMTDRVERQLKSTPYSNIFRALFETRLQPRIRCLGECGTVRQLTAEVTPTIGLEIKDLNSLEDSLQAFTAPMTISDYRCDACGKNVSISKSALFGHLSPYLMFQLKRFALDYETFTNKKINSRFVFPASVNMEPYTVEAEERKRLQERAQSDPSIIVPSRYSKHPESYYTYDLAGVIVHAGTAQSGHYYSFIRDRSKGPLPPGVSPLEAQWYRFDDTRVTLFDALQQLDAETFGGKEDDRIVGFGSDGTSTESSSGRSAYMLFYERRGHDHGYDHQPELRERMLAAIEAHKRQAAAAADPEVKADTSLPDSQDDTFIFSGVTPEDMAKPCEQIIPPRVMEKVNRENVLAARATHINSPQFLRLIAQLPVIAATQIKEDKDREVIRKVVKLSLDYLFRRAVKSQSSGSVTTITTLTAGVLHACRRDTTLASSTLEYLLNSPSLIVDGLLAHREAEVRQMIASLIAVCTLEVLRAEEEAGKLDIPAPTVDKRTLYAKEIATRSPESGDLNNEDAQVVALIEAEDSNPDALAHRAMEINAPCASNLFVRDRAADIGSNITTLVATWTARASEPDATVPGQDSLAVRMAELLLALLDEASKNWLRISGYEYLLTQVITLSSPRFRDMLVLRRAPGRLADFVLGSASPTKSKRVMPHAEMGNTHQSMDFRPFYNLISLLVCHSRTGIVRSVKACDATDTEIQLAKAKVDIAETAAPTAGVDSESGEHKPPSNSLQEITDVLRYVRPPTTLADGGRVALSPECVGVIANETFFTRGLVATRNGAPLIAALQHLAFMDASFSPKALTACTSQFVTHVADPVGDFPLLLAMVSINDCYLTTRVEKVAATLIKLASDKIRYSPEVTYMVCQLVLRLALHNDYFAKVLIDKRADWDILDKWTEEYAKRRAIGGIIRDQLQIDFDATRAFYRSLREVKEHSEAEAYMAAQYDANTLASQTGRSSNVSSQLAASGPVIGRSDGDIGRSATTDNIPEPQSHGKLESEKKIDFDFDLPTAGQLPPPPPASHRKRPGASTPPGTRSQTKFDDEIARQATKLRPASRKSPFSHTTDSISAGKSAALNSTTGTSTKPGEFNFECLLFTASNAFPNGVRAPYPHCAPIRIESSPADRWIAEDPESILKAYGAAKNEETESGAKKEDEDPEKATKGAEDEHEVPALEPDVELPEGHDAENPRANSPAVTRDADDSAVVEDLIGPKPPPIETKECESDKGGEKASDAKQSPRYKFHRAFLAFVVSAGLEPVMPKTLKPLPATTGGTFSTMWNGATGLSYGNTWSGSQHSTYHHSSHPYSLGSHNDFREHNVHHRNKRRHPDDDDDDFLPATGYNALVEWNEAATTAGPTASTTTEENWSCSACTYSNMPHMRICEMCDTPRK